jgi:hypothetical protein
VPYREGWEDALACYKARIDDAQTGAVGGMVSPEVSSRPSDGLRVKDLMNEFLTFKLGQLKNGDIGQRMFGEYKSITDLAVEHIGGVDGNRLVASLNTKDFQKLRSHMADRWGPVRLDNGIQRVRTVFKYGYDSGLIDNPVRYGPSFKKPPARIMRNNRKNKMLMAEECRALIDAAPVPVKAMILLGINAGFGNHDFAGLPLSALDLKAGWVDYRRNKTGIDRRCPLWADKGKDIIREFVKTSTCIALNAADQVKANGSIWKLVNEHPREKFIWEGFGF